jgi:ribosomal protein S18 acetylase RimI-like enzyme
VGLEASAHPTGFTYLSPEAGGRDRVIHVGAARLEDREAALRLVFLHFDAGEREKRVANALRLMEAGQLNPDGLFVLRHGAAISGAMICMPIRGAGALVWPPRTRDDVPDTVAVEDQLISRAVSWLRPRGAKLGQALLDRSETHLAAPLERNGFRNVTTLCYMRRAAGQALDGIPQGRLCYQPYDSADRATFAETLLRTYDGSRDCPEVNGVRTIDEILDGHAADAGTNFDRWWLAFDGTRPVGVLLVTEPEEWQAWEVAYVGVVPEARGRGLGRELMQHAVGMARSAEAKQLTLCVDVRNAPAIALYRGLGFERYDERAVYLAVWCENQPGKQPFSR